MFEEADDNGKGLIFSSYDRSSLAQPKGILVPQNFKPKFSAKDWLCYCCRCFESFCFWRFLYFSLKRASTIDIPGYLTYEDFVRIVEWSPPLGVLNKID